MQVMFVRWPCGFCAPIFLPRDVFVETGTGEVRRSALYYCSKVVYHSSSRHYLSDLAEEQTRKSTRKVFNLFLTEVHTIQYCRVYIINQANSVF